MTWRSFLAAMAITSLALLTTGCGGNEKKDSRDTGVSEESVTEKSTESETSGEKNVKITIGKAFTAEGIDQTINFALDNWANPEDVYGFETGDEGMKMVAVNLTLENTNSSESDVSNLYYTLNYGGTEPAEMSYYGSNATNIARFQTNGTLAAGTTYTGDLLFEVPSNTSIENWSLIYNSDFLDFRTDNEVVTTALK